MIKELFDKSDRKLDELTEEMRATKQRLAGLEQEAPQPHLVTEAYVPVDTKTRKRMEDVAAERVISGDDSSAQVDTDPMCLTSFGDDSIGPPARGDAYVNSRRWLTPHRPSLYSDDDHLSLAVYSWSLGETKKRISRINNQLAPSGGRLYKKKQLCCSIQAVLQMVYAPTRFWKRGARCFVGRFFVWALDCSRGWSVFGQKDNLEYHFPREVQAIRRTKRIAVDRCLCAARLV